MIFFTRPLRLLPFLLAFFSAHISTAFARDPSAEYLSPSGAREFYLRARDQMSQLLMDWSGDALTANGRALSWKWHGRKLFIAVDSKTFSIAADSEDIAPIAEEFSISAFELLCPFFYWPGPTYEGPSKVIGRRAHRFSIKAPSASRCAVAEVHIWLDSVYDYPLYWEAFDADGQTLRRFRLRSLKKDGEGKWTVSAVEFSSPKDRRCVRIKIL